MKITGNTQNLSKAGAIATDKTDKSDKAGKIGRADADALSKAKKPISNEEIGSSVRVDFSDRAKEIKKVKELATPSNDIDEAKVARLQKMIDEGNYKVDADAIAERMMSEHLTMS